MTHVVIFGRGEKPITAALVQGAAVIGIRPTLQRPHLEAGVALPLPNAQAVFMDGLRGPLVKFFDAYRAVGVPVFLVDLPRLRYGAEGAVGIFRNSLADLPFRVGNRVTVQGRLLNRAPTYLLVCGQKPADMAHRLTLAQQDAWARDAIQMGRIAYEAEVVYRAHPLDTRPVPRDWFGADHLSPSTIPLRDVLQATMALVTYNSTAGVEAIDAGVPVLYTAPAEKVPYAAYSEVFGRPVQPITDAQRRTFLMRCGATQWTLAQIAEGTMMEGALLGYALPAPELIEPEQPPALKGKALNRRLSREVMSHGG